ncbi:hypothetical protein K438DRAFT_1874660 [Mycena galopus ATCC 62051]|nr:hypothetical protein K438DRAFT_1874660 [Mycena galopus ATCC 62051]
MQLLYVFLSLDSHLLPTRLRTHTSAARGRQQERAHRTRLLLQTRFRKARSPDIMSGAETSASAPHM